MKQINLILLLLFTSTHLQAQTTEKAFLIGNLLDKANQQRMLTQQIAKLYTAIYVSSSDITTYKITLNQAIRKFEQHNTELQSFKINLKYHQLLEDIMFSWDDYISLINQRPSKENLLLLFEQNTTILNQCNTLVEELTQYALRFSKKHQTSGIHYDIIQLGNTAGYQRMLSQRILFYYLAYQAIIEENASIKTILNNSLVAYEATIDQLMASPLNSPEIDYRLKLLSKEWSTISTHYQNKVKDVDQLEAILQKDNSLLNSMNTITELYSTLVDQQATLAFFDNAIDMANKQSILTQKMTEQYISSVREPKQKSHSQQIKEQIELFEYHIDELKLFAPATEITNALNKVDLLWTDYRNALLSVSDQTQAQVLLSTNQTLLNACEQVTELLSLHAKISQKKALNSNNHFTHWLQKLKHQKVLAARILMFSQAILGNINSHEQNIKAIEQAGYAFVDNLNSLNLQLNNNEIQLQIQTLIQNWRKIKPHISVEQQDKEALQVWAQNLPIQIDHMVSLFEKNITQIVVQEAIEVINHQALLSQQIACTTIAINMQLDQEQQQQQLKKYKLRFQQNLVVLDQFATTPILKELISTLQLRWANYQLIIDAPIDQQKIALLLEKSNALLANCTKIVNCIQEEHPNLIQINRVAQMRTLTEQLLVFILIERWGIDHYKEETIALLKQFALLKEHLITSLDASSQRTSILTQITTYYDRLCTYHADVQEVDLYSILLAQHNLLIYTDKLTQLYTNETVIK